MNKICTTREQSQKLIELGIDVDTADMWYDIGLGTFPSNIPQVKFNNDGKFIDCYYLYPAWSLAALFELMPFQIIEDNKRYGFKQYKGYNSQGETYRFEYASNIGTTLYETYHLNNLIDAAFDMICWLLENKKI